MFRGDYCETKKNIFSLCFANTHSFDGDVVGNPSNSPENPSIWIFKVDSTGELLWQQCIGGHADERVHGAIKQSDYKYTVVGEMNFSPSLEKTIDSMDHGNLNVMLKHR